MDRPSRPTCPTPTVEPNRHRRASRAVWVDLTVDLSAYTGNVLLGFQYRSDSGVNFAGFMVDDIQVSGSPLDGAETDAGWTFHLPHRVPGHHWHRRQALQPVLRPRVPHIQRLRRGAQGRPVLLRVSGQPGTWQLRRSLRVSGWPVDQLLGYLAGGQQHRSAPGARVAAADRRSSGNPDTASMVESGATASRPTTRPSGSTGPTASRISTRTAYCRRCPSLPAVKVFDDRKNYYDATNPLGSVINPNTGTLITVQSWTLGSFMQIEVRPAK